MGTCPGIASNPRVLVKLFRARLGDQPDPQDAPRPAGFDERGGDLFTDAVPAIRRQHDQILNVAIGDSVGNDPAHAGQPRRLPVDGDGEGEAAPHQRGDTGCIPGLLPPAARPVQIDYLSGIPRVDQPDFDIGHGACLLAHLDIIAHDRLKPLWREKADGPGNGISAMRTCIQRSGRSL